MSDHAHDTSGTLDQAAAGRRRRPRAKARSGSVKSRSAESRLAAIERLLSSPVDTVIDGRAAKRSTLEAICYRLLQASLSGDKKASRALQKFDEFASQHSVPEFEIVFVDNEYTRAFSASREGENV